MGLNVTAAPFLVVFTDLLIFYSALLEVSKLCGSGRVRFYCSCRKVKCVTVPAGEQLLDWHILRPQILYMGVTFWCYEIALLILM